MSMSKVGRRVKTGGRKKGVPNKRSFDLAMRLSEAGHDPLIDLIRIMPELEVRDRAQANLHLMSYLYPRRKAVEITQDPENNLKRNDVIDDKIKASVVTELKAMLDDLKSCPTQSYPLLPASLPQ